MESNNIKNNFTFLNDEEIEILKNYNYLIIGCNEIGFIIAKNLTLLNVDKITWIDDKILIENQKNKKKSEIYRKKLNKIADDTEIGTAKTKDIELYIQTNNLIIINELFSIDLIKKWNDIAFEHKNKIVWNLNLYLKGLIITDFNFIRVKYPFIKKVFNKITNITNEEMGRLSLEENHNLENNDFISISEVEGMENINGNECRPIKVLNKKEILIENTKNFEKYKNSGKIIKINVPHNLYYNRISNLIENNLLNNTYLIVKYGQITTNLWYLFFIIIKNNDFVEKIKKREINDKELEEHINNILNNNEIKKKINFIQNLDILQDIILTIFKNEPENDLVFNSIIGNLSFHEIIKISGKFKPIPGFLILDFLNFFPNIKTNLEKHIENFFANNSFKIIFIGYNKIIIKKLIKMLIKIKPLNSKFLEIFIFDISKENTEEIQNLSNIQINFVTNPFKEENKILDFDLIFCMIYDPNIIYNYFYKCKKYEKKLFTLINYNFQIKLIYTEEDYIKYGLFKKTIISSKDLIILKNKENNLSLDLINYSNQIYKIIFEEPLINLKNCTKDQCNYDDLMNFNKDGLYIFLVYFKLNLLKLIKEKNNLNIEELLELSYILIYKLIRLNFEEKTTLNFIKKNYNSIRKYIKKFSKLVLKLSDINDSDKYKEIYKEIKSKLNNYKTLSSSKVKNFIPADIKTKFENLFNEANKLEKGNLKYRISLLDRIENFHENIIIDFIYIISWILSEIYPTKVQIQKKNIEQYLGIFKNNLVSCNNFENILIIIIIIKKTLNKEDLNLSLDFEINEYNF